MKAKDLILVSLICVNVALATVALTFYASRAESQAVAGMTTSRAGDYVMATASLSSTTDTVLVIDVTAKRANLYVPVIVPGAAPGGSWELKSTRNLATDFRR
jgi:hypothetical protein